MGRHGPLNFEHRVGCSIAASPVLYDKQRLGTKHGCGKKSIQKNKVELRGNRAAGDYMMAPDEAGMVPISKAGRSVAQNNPNAA
jgi:hypothetical protein